MRSKCNYRDGVSSTLLHQRLHHMREKAMNMLASKGKILQLKNVTVNFKPCVFGKQNRVTFVKTGQLPKSEKLEPIYYDVFGPTSVSST